MTLFASLEISNGQVFDMTSSWTEITVNLMDKSYCLVKNYYLEGDTIISDNLYTKIYLNNQLYDAALRETGENKIYAYFYSLRKEILVYDFAWEIGKDIYFEYYEPIRSGEGFYKNITQIDSIQLLDGVYNKYLPCSDKSGIIQGVGNTDGFFYYQWPIRPTNGDQYSLLCFSKNGRLIYQNKDYKTCYSCEKADVASVDDLKTDKNRFRALNVEKGVVIDCNVENEGAFLFQVYDTTGHRVSSFLISGQKQLTINNLSQGCYFYQATGEKNKYSGKFIITK